MIFLFLCPSFSLFLPPFLSSLPSLSPFLPLPLSLSSSLLSFLCFPSLSPPPLSSFLSVCVSPLTLFETSQKPGVEILASCRNLCTFALRCWYQEFRGWMLLFSDTSVFVMVSSWKQRGREWKGELLILEALETPLLWYMSLKNSSVSVVFLWFKWQFMCPALLLADLFTSTHFWMTLGSWLETWGRITLFRRGRHRTRIFSFCCLLLMF